MKKHTAAQRNAHREFECYAFEAQQTATGIEVPVAIRLGRICNLQGVLAQTAALVMAHALEISKQPGDPSVSDLQAYYLGLAYYGETNRSPELLALTELAVDGETSTAFNDRIGAKAAEGREAMSRANRRAFTGWYAIASVVMGSIAAVHYDHRTSFKAYHNRFLVALKWAQSLDRRPDNSDELQRFTDVLTRTRHVMAIQQMTVEAMFKG